MQLQGLKPRENLNMVSRNPNQYAPSTSNSTKNATTTSSALSNKNGIMLNVPSHGTLMMMNTAASTNSVANEEHHALGNTMSSQHLLMNR